MKRAAILHPNDPDIEHNLKLSYLRTVDHLEPVPDLFFVQWMRAIAAAMAPDTARLFFMTSWLMLFGSLILIYLVLRPEALRIVRIVFFASCFSLYYPQLCWVYNYLETHLRTSYH